VLTGFIPVLTEILRYEILVEEKVNINNSPGRGLEEDAKDEQAGEKATHEYECTNRL
jgi:hypothetical protein